MRNDDKKNETSSVLGIHAFTYAKNENPENKKEVRTEKEKEMFDLKHSQYWPALGF